jgi:hypothetical protein
MRKGSNAVTKEEAGIATPFNLDAVLGSAAKKEKKDKSSVVTLNVSKEMQELATKIRTTLNEIKSLSSMVEAEEAELLVDIKPLRKNELKKGYVSTFRIPTLDKASISLSWMSKYSKLKDPESITAVKAIMGDKFDTMMEPKMEIKVKPESQTEEGLKDLIAGIGAAQLLRRGEDFDYNDALAEGASLFENVVQVERWYTPTSNYTVGMLTLFDEAKAAELELHIKQNEPSFKPNN